VFIAEKFPKNTPFIFTDSDTVFIAIVKQPKNSLDFLNQGIDSLHERLRRFTRLNKDIARKTWIVPLFFCTLSPVNFAAFQNKRLV
jgi:hypothetical protein